MTVYEAICLMHDRYGQNAYLPFAIIEKLPDMLGEKYGEFLDLKFWLGDIAVKYMRERYGKCWAWNKEPLPDNIDAIAILTKQEEREFTKRLEKLPKTDGILACQS